MLQDQQSVSYLDILKQTTLKDQKPTIYLTILVGEISKGTDKSSLASYFQKIFKKHSTENEKVTGMLLIFRNSFLHVLEASQKVVGALMADLASEGESEDTDKPPYEENTRVLLFTEGLSTSDKRRFPFWSSKIIESKNDSKPLDWSMMDEQSVDDQITAVCVQLLNIGKSLCSLGKNDVKDAFEDIAYRYSGQIPTPTLTLELASQPTICSVKDWVKQFQGELEISLESDLTWPSQKPLILI